MTVTVSEHQAKAQLADVIDRVLRGEDIVIVRNGTHCVRLVAIASAAADRSPGTYAGGIQGDITGEIGDTTQGAWG